MRAINNHSLKTCGHNTLRRLPITMHSLVMTSSTLGDQIISDPRSV
jgi:hypothetical protein